MRNKILFILAFSLLFSSCLFDEKDLFDKPASERIQDAKVEAKAVLEGASNGWHVRYFPSPNKEFGGYNVFFKFENGEVTIASETMDDFSKPVTSLYSMGEDLGVTLNLDTKNSVINYFVHPKNPDGLGSTYKGVEGDYKFTVLSATPEEVVLRGIITGNKYVMTPIADGVSWEDELRQIVTAADDMEFTSYTFEINGKSYPVSLTNRRFAVKISDEETVYAPFLYTKTGISLYEPITIDGQTAQDFNFVDEYYFEEINKVPFKIMTPAPLRSDITFNLTVPEGELTYRTANVNVAPSRDEEFYYVHVMTRTEFESKSEKKLLQEIVGSLNDGFGAGDDVEKLAEDVLYKAQSSSVFDFLSLYDEYVAVAFGCAVTDNAIVSTTKMTTVPFKLSPSLLPDSIDPDYKRWLGKWEVTSTTSELGLSYTFTITVKPYLINSNFSIIGWGLTTYADQVHVTATYSGGMLRLTGNQDNLMTTKTGRIYLANKYVNRDNPSSFGILNSTNAANLAATYDGDGRATMVGRNGSLTSGVKFTISTVELYERRAGSTSNYYLPFKPGISRDFMVGPYSMKQVLDADGNPVD